MTNDPAAPHLGGDLVLVGPPAVVGHRLAAEHVVEGRVVDQEQQDLARHVDAREVVPVVFGRDRAVAHEDELPVDRHLVDHVLRPGDVVRARLEGPGLAPGRAHLEGVPGGRCDPDQRHVLHPGPIGVARRETDRLELLGEIRDRQLLARRAGSTPLELVRRQPLDLLEQRGLRDARCRGRRRGRVAGRRLRGGLRRRTATRRHQEEEGRRPQVPGSVRAGPTSHPTLHSKKLIVSTRSSTCWLTGCPPECPAWV